MRIRCSTRVVGAALLAASATAAAQDPAAGGDITAEEIIVTATKRASAIQDVPFSVNAQTADDIEKLGSSNIEELSRNVAGLTIQNLGPGQSQVAVRGVSAGQIVRDQPGVKEQVGVYLDESVDLAVAVHARHRPLRPQPRRDAARPAGHAVRLGLDRRHDPLHHQSARARPHRRRLRGEPQHGDRRRHRRAPEGRGQLPAGRARGAARRRLFTRNTAASSTRCSEGGGATRTSTTATAAAPAWLCASSRPTTSRSRRASSTSRST